MGKRYFISALLFLMAISGFSRSLSFQIVQHNDSMTSVCQSAYVIEDEILNYFFDAGYIVSNAEASISSSSEQDKKLWCDGFYEASDGSFDEFVQIHLYFSENTKASSERVALGMIDKVSWTITSIKTGKCLEDEKQNVKKPMGADSEENVRLFATDFASHIKKVINTRV